MARARVKIGSPPVSKKCITCGYSFKTYKPRTKKYCSEVCSRKIRYRRVTIHRRK